MGGNRGKEGGGIEHGDSTVHGWGDRMQPSVRMRPTRGEKLKFIGRDGGEESGPTFGSWQVTDGP